VRTAVTPMNAAARTSCPPQVVQTLRADIDTAFCRLVRTMGQCAVPGSKPPDSHIDEAPGLGEGRVLAQVRAGDPGALRIPAVLVTEFPFTRISSPPQWVWHWKWVPGAQRTNGTFSG